MVLISPESLKMRDQFKNLILLHLFEGLDLQRKDMKHNESELLCNSLAQQWL